MHNVFKVYWFLTTIIWSAIHVMNFIHDMHEIYTITDNIFTPIYEYMYQPTNVHIVQWNYNSSPIFSGTTIIYSRWNVDIKAPGWRGGGTVRDQHMPGFPTVWWVFNPNWIFMCGFRLTSDVYLKISIQFMLEFIQRFNSFWNNTQYNKNENFEIRVYKSCSFRLGKTKEV